METLLLIFVLLVSAALNFILFPLLAATSSGWAEIESKYPAVDARDLKAVSWSFFGPTYKLPWYLGSIGYVTLKTNSAGLWISAPRKLWLSKPALVPWSQLLPATNYGFFGQVIVIQISGNRSISMSKKLFFELLKSVADYWQEGQNFAVKLKQGAM